MSEFQILSAIKRVATAFALLLATFPEILLQAVPTDVGIEQSNFPANRLVSLWVGRQWAARLLLLSWWTDPVSIHIRVLESSVMQIMPKHEDFAIPGKLILVHNVCLSCSPFLLDLLYFSSKWYWVIQVMSYADRTMRGFKNILVSPSSRASIMASPADSRESWISSHLHAIR